ncbi:MAG: hypothetical protein MJZ50_05420 [Treponema sp.]|nr:hypothetical protein [Treponema sp.]
MKRIVYFCLIVISLVFISCVSISSEKNRNLIIDGYTVNEQDFGGCERWYAVDKYNYDDLFEKVRIQVGYFKDNNIGFVLYEDGTVGEEAYFSRKGLDLRWDWGIYESNGSTRCKYSFVIEPDGTGLYYDFSISDDGIAKPRGIYRCKKF